MLSFAHRWATVTGLFLSSFVACGGIAVDGDEAGGAGGGLGTGASPPEGGGGVVASGGVLAVGGAGATGGFAATGGGPTEPAAIFPPSADPYGFAHEEWLARYWQWFLSIPRSIHPREGGDCGLAQGADVWFLTTGRNQLAEERKCTVPPGVPLFIAGTSTIDFPMPDCWDCVHEDTDGPVAWLSEFPANMVASANAISPSTIHIEIDGVPFRVAEDYLWASEVPFLADVPATDSYFDCSGPMGDNQCGWPTGTPRPFGAAGYAVMIQPLSPGPHVLRFGASRQSGWQTDVTYHLWVE